MFFTALTGSVNPPVTYSDVQVRVAAEGINGTVGGTEAATELYILAMMSHPLFRMEREDFKVGIKTK